MAQQEAVRTFNGVQVPESGTWTIDASHSSVSFSVRHLIGRVNGNFPQFEGTANIAESAADSSIEVFLDAASITTGNEQRDGHLRSPDFFDTDNNPKIVFRSTGLVPATGENFKLDGELTIAGVTRPVTLDATLEGIGADPWGNTRSAFSATTEINRDDFGVKWNQVLETGGVLVGSKVRISIEVQLVKAS